MEPDESINVLGGPLAACSYGPRTGYFRDGHCNTCAADQGSHTVCAVMTAEFLAYSKYVGNDLSTPMPQFQFPGLKSGDHWASARAAFCKPTTKAVPHWSIWKPRTYVRWRSCHWTSSRAMLTSPARCRGIDAVGMTQTDRRTGAQTAPSMSNPRTFATVKISLSPRPHIFMQIR